MTNQIERQTLGFSSADGKSQIKGLLWQPRGTTAASPRGVVQIVHGMAEHIGRYDEFARFLAGRGFVVCGHDHIGHGRSAASPEDWGHMPVRGGDEVLVQDVHALRTLVSSRFARSVPYFIFGHSMGSFVTRVYIAEHGEGLAGAILCGTGNTPIALSKAGNLLSRLLAKVKGERAGSLLVHSMADGAFIKAVENPRTEYDWISRNPDNVDAYIADEMSGFPFTVGGYAALTAVTAKAASLNTAFKVPKSLPLYFIAGSEDPVGENGKGVQSAVDLMRTAGIGDVEMRIYEGMRHEILNEADRQLVFDDVLAWLKAHGAREGVA